MRSYSYYGNVALEETEKVKTRSLKKRITVKRFLSFQEKLLYLIAVFVLVCVSTVILTRYAQISQYNYKIQQLDQQIEQIQDYNKELSLKSEALKTRQRIKQMAKNELGMAPVMDDHIIFVHSPNLKDSIR